MLPNNRGFTLIELLVALALLVILSGALYGTYFSVTAARERGGARSQARREISSTLGTLRNELASAYYTGMNGISKDLHFVVGDRDTFGKPSSLLQFTTIAPPRVDAAPSSDQITVRYMVQEKEGVLTLTREATDKYVKPEALPYPALENLDGFLVECYDGAKWVKSWDTALNTRLPDSVRVTLTLKGGENFAIVATPGMVRRSGTTFPKLSLDAMGSLPNIPALGTPQP